MPRGGSLFLRTFPRCVAVLVTTNSFHLGKQMKIIKQVWAFLNMRPGNQSSPAVKKANRIAKWVVGVLIVCTTLSLAGQILAPSKPTNRSLYEAELRAEADYWRSLGYTPTVDL